MKLSAKTLTGRIVPLEVTATTTILEVKKQIEADTGSLPKHQKLIFGAKTLDDSLTMASYPEIKENDTIHVVPTGCFSSGNAEGGKNNP